MFGDIVNMNHRVALATADAPSLAGVGISMEGIDQNPVYYAAALDAVWQLVNATDAREGLEGDDEASRRGVVSSNSSGCPNCCEPSCLCACGVESSLRAGAGADPHFPHTRQRPRQSAVVRHRSYPGLHAREAGRRWRTDLRHHLHRSLRDATLGRL